jgi:xanthine dehydrogenase small subunit
MIEFILNNQDIQTDLPPGTTVLDFVRYHKNLKGTKIGCREGDCGACAILVGELVEDKVRYRSMTSCLMPLANAAGKHIVTIEGINPSDGSLTPVQLAMVDESGTQCGFCTVGFVMSLTGFCIDAVSSPHVSKGSTEMAISAIDGNICRCTGYKSIERAAFSICSLAKQAEPPASAGGMDFAIEKVVVPKYFGDISSRLTRLSMPNGDDGSPTSHLLTQAVLPVGGGTDVYVQKPDVMAEAQAEHLFYDDELRGIRDTGEYIEIGASATVTDLLESDFMNAAFPNLYKHLKLVSSTPIRNMATLGGNFVNASPIGDMTVWFLALDAEITLSTGVRTESGSDRVLPLRDLYLGYKQLAKSEEEIITTIRFRKPDGDFRFSFEKVSKRTYLDISTVNTAISLSVGSPHVSKGSFAPTRALTHVRATHTILEVHVAAGGVAPIPLYLKETSNFLKGKEVNEETITVANDIMQSEISPISDVRGTEQYKRLLLRQLFRAHFVELFEE